MSCDVQHVPTGVFELFGSPLMRNIVPSILRDAFASRQLEVPADESVHAFISRRFSPSFADNLVDPMISGIYAGDVRKVSLLLSQT